MKNHIFLILLSVFAFCKNETSEVPSFIYSKEKSKCDYRKDTTGQTIASRFLPPNGHERVSTAPKSWAAYLQNLPLKPDSTPVLYFDGREKQNQDVHAAVVDLDVGKRDLQQCADAVMRLRAEYFYDAERFEDIRFKFVNGFDAEYSKWRAGKKISVKGRDAKWVPAGEKQDTRADFRKYMDIVFSYASTLSLEKEMERKELEDIDIGDVFIMGGSPGHAVIVVDVAVNEKSGDRVFMLAQSYMPAQSIHILKNPNDKKISPWYRLKPDEEIDTPDWGFYPKDLKRF